MKSAKLFSRRIYRLLDENRRNSIYNIVEKEKTVKEKARKEKPKGPRQIFLEKYQATGSIEEAKKELSNQGYNTKLYESSDTDIFQQWINEDEGR